jgi:DNA polymerase-3 subunit alpha
VRGLGESAAAAITKAKEDGGDFASLADFCDRVDLGSVDSGILESLAKAGAFDVFNPNRKQVSEYLPLLMTWAKSRTKEKRSAQTNLFDFASAEAGEDSYGSAPVMPVTGDFSKEERLAYEREILGFYASGHPLKSLTNAQKIFSPISLGELPEIRNGTEVTCLVMLSEVKVLTTKKGEVMAVCKMEDSLGVKTKGVIFPKEFASCRKLITDGSRLIAWGTVDYRDDNKQIIINDVADPETKEVVLIEIQPDQLGEDDLKTIRSVLKNVDDRKPGRVPVLAKIGSSPSEQLVRFPPRYWAKNSKTVIKGLKSTGFTASARPIRDESIRVKSTV